MASKRSNQDHHRIIPQKRTLIRRHWGPTCNNCRARKLRCPRGEPICLACRSSEKLSGSCVYDKQPSAAYMRSLSSATPASPSERQRANVSRIEATHEDDFTVIHDLPQESPDDTTIRTFDPPANDSASHRRLIDVDYLDRSRSTIERASQNIHIYAHLPIPMVRRLLYYAFTWIQPSFQIFSISSMLQRCANAQSLQAMPPIAWVVLVHADRFLGPLSKRTSEEQDQSYNLRRMCKESLSDCMYSQPSLSSVEAFMQQAACNVGAGEASQAWINSGIAFRMASDIGLFKLDRGIDDTADIVAYNNFTEIRRLFWSLYSFDKALAVYLGRIPQLIAVPPQFVMESITDATRTNADPDLVDLSEPDTILENNARMWWEEVPSLHTASKVRLHRYTFFFYQCQLMQKVQRALELLYFPTDELGKMHARLYDPRWLLNNAREVDDKGRLRKIEELCAELRDWWSFVPNTLKIVSSQTSSAAEQQQSFPCNIINLNIWYHTLTILIRRVNLIQRTSEETNFAFPTPDDHICMVAASSIESIVRLCLRTTGYHRFGFALAYGVYTAATAVTFPLVRLASNYSLRTRTEIATSEPALLLSFFIDTLSKMRSAMPGVERSYRKLCQYASKILGKPIADQIFSIQGLENQTVQQEANPLEDERDAIETTLNQSEVSGDINYDQQSKEGLNSLSSQDFSQTASSINLDDLFSLPIFPGTLQDFQIDAENSLLDLAVHEDLFI